jgi:glycosyltransferase involved in cell wall biosynthesis
MVKAATVITCVDEAEYLQRAIDSSLDQDTSFQHRVVVVQQGDNNQVGNIIHRNDVIHKQISMDNNVNRSRNLGRELADAEYVLYLDADDYSMPGRVQRSVELLEKGYDLLAQYRKSIRKENADGEIISQHKSREELTGQNRPKIDFAEASRLKKEHMTSTSSLAMRRESAVWNENVEYAQDYELMARLFSQDKDLKFVFEDLVTRTVRGESYGDRKEQKSSFRTIKQKYF